MKVILIPFLAALALVTTMPAFAQTMSSPAAMSSMMPKTMKSPMAKMKPKSMKSPMAKSSMMPKSMMSPKPMST
jgi:hypothetical protein